MKNYIFLLSAICTCLISCSEELTNQQIKFDKIVTSSQNYETVCKLNENISYLDQSIYEFRMISDSSFLVVNGSKVFIYNTQGVQLAKLGNKGNAKGEYIRATMSYCSDNYVYILCSATSKLLVYDKQGRYVKTYNSPHPHSEFIVKDDSIITFYRASTRDNIFIKRYKLGDNELIMSHGKFSKADLALFSINNSRAYSEYEDEIYYLHPSKLELNSINSKNEVKTLFNIVDSDFDVNFGIDPLTKGNYTFLKENSIVKGVHRYNKSIYILAETGIMSYNNGKMDSNDTRRLNIFEVRNNKPLRQVIFDWRDEFMIPNYFYKDYLYSIKTDQDGYFNLCRLKL